MIRKETLKDQILTALVLAADVLGAVGGTVPVKNRYRMIYGMLGAASSSKREKIDTALEELIDGGFVETQGSDVPYLTAAGQEVKKGLLREQQKDWDGKWRVVFFDIPEKKREKRDALRRELISLGFGSWQRSAWVIPFDVTNELLAYIKDKKLTKEVEVFVGDRPGETSDREFTAAVWPVEEINKRYQKFLDAWSKELKRESSGEERREAIVQLQNRFLRIFVDDPHLPPELLPLDWKGEEAKKLYSKLTSMIVPLQTFTVSSEA